MHRLVGLYRLAGELLGVEQQTREWGEGMVLQSREFLGFRQHCELLLQLLFHDTLNSPFEKSVVKEMGQPEVIR